MFEALIRRGTLVTVVVLIVTVFGAVAAMRLPVQMIPDLEVRTITVRTAWPGATPQDIEKEILIEQEEFLRNLPNLERLIATAESGSARIALEFPYDIDITETLIRVNNALSRVSSYPQTVTQPRVYATSFSSNSFMYLRVSPLAGNPRNLDMMMMRDFIDDTVRTRLETIPGVSRVSVWGGAERQIQVLLDPGRLAATGIALTQVRDALRQRNRDVSGGDLEGGKRRFLLRTIGRFEGLDDLRRLIVARHGDSVVRLSDLGEVRLGHFEITRHSLVNGDPVIALAVRRELGSNVIAIKEGILERMESLNAEVLNPAGLELDLTADDVTYVSESLRNVWTNLAIGTVLATLVMYAFLRSARATLVGVMGIPLCTVAAFLGLMLTGRTVNVISLAGVAFAIGMTLDNTIVVLESIDLERRRGLERFRAAVEGVRRVWPAVVASTLTTVLVFVPIVFIAEEAGQLYSDVAVAISASILLSMLVAVSVVPTASARLSFGADTSGGAAPGEGGALGWIAAAVARLIATPTRRIACVVTTLAASAAIIAVLTPPAEYLPEGEEAKIFAAMSAPPGYNLSTMRRIGLEVQEHFLPFVGDDPERFARGEAAVPALKYLNLSITAERVRIIAEPRHRADIGALMDAILAKYRTYPGMRAFASRGSIITSNDGGTRSVNLDISGPRLADIYAVALAAYRRAKEVFDNPRVRADPSTLSLSQPLIEIHPRHERADALGMSAEDVGFTVAALTDGAFAGEFFRDDDKIDIYFYSRGGTAAGLDDLKLLPVHTPNGGTVPLSALAEIRETVDTSTIRRMNGRRTVTLNIIPPDDVALETGVARVREEVVGHLQRTGAVPAGVGIGISGASDQLDATRAALADNYAVAIIVVYLLLVAIFTHWGYPLLIMTTIPLGIAGGIVGLALMNAVGAMLPLIGLQPIHQPFDMISMLGFLILLGTVVNNPILLVHRAMTNMAEGAASALEAVAEAVSSRVRPIVMSTVTTICGLAPLVFIPGAGTELYRGVGAIVLFGLLGAAVVTLTFLPAVTVMVLSWRRPAKDH